MSHVSFAQIITGWHKVKTQIGDHTSFLLHFIKTAPNTNGVIAWWASGLHSAGRMRPGLKNSN